MADLVNSMVSYAHGLCLKLGLVGLWLCFSVRLYFTVTILMKFIRHSGSTTQYNTMQSNLKKQKKEKREKSKKRKKEKKKKSELKHA